MIISPNRRFVFVHIHKCAGTSIEVALASQLGVNDLVIGSTADGERNKPFFQQLVKLKKHSTAQEARAVLGEALWDQYFRFAFVRDPLSRLRSLYSYARGLAQKRGLNPQELAQWQNGGKLPAGQPFRFKAVQAALAAEDFDGFLRNPLTWQDPGAKPQWQMLCDADGKMLVDFVGKVEHLARDWPKVEKRLGLTVAVGNENRSASAEVAASELSAEAWAQVRKHCLRDYKLLNYPVPSAIQALAPGKRAASLTPELQGS